MLVYVQILNATFRIPQICQEALPQRENGQFYELFLDKGEGGGLWPYGFNYKLHLITETFGSIKGKGREDDEKRGLVIKM